MIRKVGGGRGCWPDTISGGVSGGMLSTLGPIQKAGWHGAVRFRPDTKSGGERGGAAAKQKRGGTLYERAPPPPP